MVLSAKKFALRRFCRFSAKPLFSAGFSRWSADISTTIASFRIISTSGHTFSLYTGSPCCCLSFWRILIEVSHQQNLVTNKTQCQLCKRLAAPIIHLSWSCLVWKRVSLWMSSLGAVNNHVLGHFRHGDEQTNKQTNRRPTGWSCLQACFWPVLEGSLL